jgi:fatty acid omega-hydroxylase
MSLQDNTALKNAGMAAAAVASVITLLAIKYNDRPIFYEHRKGIPYNKGLPLVGNLPSIMYNLPRHYDQNVELFEKHDTLTL